MSNLELVIVGYLVVRLIEVIEQAWVNWCTMKVRLSIRKDKDDEKVGFE